MSSLLAALKNAIDDAQIVSFDIFDTALTRATEKPVDVFHLLAHECGARDAAGFVQARIQAEILARKRAWAQKQAVEITLGQIYSILAESGALQGLNPDSVQEAERRIELRLCRPHPLVRQAYEHALNTGKKVGFLSDMYLDPDLLGRMLNKCGYLGHTFLWVSSDLGVTKANGGLYELALRRLGASPSAMLHVGDNHHADIQQSAKYGIRNFHLPKCCDLLPKGPRGRRLTRAGIAVQSTTAGSSAFVPPSFASVWRGLVAFRQLKPRGFWYDLGYAHIGALYLGFALWLEQRARQTGVDHLFFLARDGHVMHRVHECLVERGVARIPGSYLFASRRALNVPALTAVDESACDFLVSGTSRITVRAFLERIGLDVAHSLNAVGSAGFSTPDQVVNSGEEYGRLRALFRELAPDILKRAADERALVRRYFAEQGVFDKKHPGLVDIGWHGSLQDSFSRLMTSFGQNGSQVAGFYLGTFKAARKREDMGARHAAYLFQGGRPTSMLRVVMRSVEMFEWFFCAPHPSVVGFRQGTGGIEPAYESGDLEKSRQKTAMAMQVGALDFIRDVLDAYGRKAPPIIPPDVAVSMIAELLNRPSLDEARILGDLPHAEGFGNVVQTRPLARPDGSIHSPWTWPRLRRGYATSFWKRAYLRRSVPRFLEKCFF